MKQGQKSRSSSASQRRGRGVEETVSETVPVSPTSTHTTTPNSKSKDPGEKVEGQSTLDKHLKPITSTDDENLDSRHQAFSEPLNKLASQEFIESKFKQMVTAEFLSSKLKALENEVKREIKKEVEKINKQVLDLKNRVKTVEKTVEGLQNEVSDMETSMSNLQKENSEMSKENKKMKEQLAEREVKLQTQSDEINSLEQYTRKNIVRIYGVSDKNPKETAAETARQVVKLINEKLKLSISTPDIDMARRMGRYSAEANRPIICKFVSRFTKLEVIKSRRELKGTAIVIREDLTFQIANRSKDM